MDVTADALSIAKQVASRSVLSQAIAIIAERRVVTRSVEEFDDGFNATGVVSLSRARATAEVAAEVGVEVGVDFAPSEDEAHEFDDIVDYRSGTAGVSYGCSCAFLPEGAQYYDDDGGPCAHSVALLLQTISAYGPGGQTARVPARVQAPASRLSGWAHELDTALPAPRREVRATLCLFITALQPSSSRLYSHDAATLSMRPGILGSRGKWIRGSAKWSNVEQLGGSREATRALVRIRAVAERYSTYYSTNDWLDLSRAPGDALWATLRDAAKAIAIVSAGANQRPVTFLDGVGKVEGLVSRQGDHLEISARLSIGAAGGDETHVTEHPWWIGTPTAAFALIEQPSAANERITIAKLTDPLTQVGRKLLAMPEPLVIPESERAAFEDEYLPRLLAELRLVSPDDSYTIPQPAAPTLRLEITYETAGAGRARGPDGARQTRLAWKWHRPDRFPRDPALERPILAALRETLLKTLPESIADLVCPDLTFPSGLGFPEEPGSDTFAPPRSSLNQTQSVQFVTEALPGIREIDGVEVIEHSETPNYQALDTVPKVDIRAQESGDWFDLHVSVQVEGEIVEFASLFTALTLGDALFVLPSGKYFSLMSPEFDKLREILNEARALVDGDKARFSEGVRVNRHNVDLWNDLRELGIVAAQEADWWLAMQSLGPNAEIPRVTKPKGIKATLRDYQEDGLAWLHFLRAHGLGGILADDMGLGKTLQTIAMMELAREEDPQMPPFLVVAPTSVVSNWASECARFAPAMQVATITGMEGKRGAPLADAVHGANVVVTSYALFRGEAEAYRDLEWSGLILDEAQQIKNFASHGHRAARMLGAPFTLVVTGTPLENNLLELWALTSLACPGLLGNRAKFTEFYRTPIEKQQNPERLALLQRRLRPFLLRRTKDLVAKELPPKQEQVIEVELHPRHRKLYDLRFQRERQKILGLVTNMEANRFQIFKSLTMLRQLALDPALVERHESKASQASTVPSAKLEALVELLTEAADEGHRVLVLSQFTRFLGSARDRAEAAGLVSCYLDGSTTNRGEVIDEFRTGDAPVFFVSLKAGGFGLNLVEADYVVLLDPWWNPAVEAQAIDRTHRIGQERPVFVYRLVAANTIEKKVIALRESKAELFGRVLDGGGASPGTISADDILDLLG
ncbi:DEAD/DEAH box helicase [Leucobacter sp. HY1910]